MNFYPHHIGDYLTATAHLTWLEDCAYRRLLDVYYSRECAIPGDISKACRLVRASSKDERRAVETVLKEFFVLSSDTWNHSRCDLEIVKAKEAAERARANGKKGGRPPKEAKPRNPEETHLVISGNPEKSNSQAPITNPITSYSVPNGTGEKPPNENPEEQKTKDELWSAGKSLLREQGMPAAQCGTFVGKLVKDYGADTVVEAVRSAVVERPADAVSFLKAACMARKGEGGKTLIPWHATDTGVIAKGAELGKSPNPGETMLQFKARVVEAIDSAGKPPNAPKILTSITTIAEPARVELSPELAQQRSAELKTALKRGSG